jgi:hypothetical protein
MNSIFQDSVRKNVDIYYFPVQPISPYQSLTPRFFSELLPADTANFPQQPGVSSLLSGDVCDLTYEAPHASK